MSSFQAVKIAIVETIGLSKDAIHIYLGFVVFLATILATRRTPESYASLVPVLAVSLILEILDLRDDYMSLGLFRWWASLKDIANTNLIPVILVLLFRYSRWRE